MLRSLHHLQLGQVTLQLGMLHVHFVEAAADQLRVYVILHEADIRHVSYRRTNL